MKKEKLVKVNLKNYSYNIVIKQNLLPNCSLYIKNLNIGKKILIITQTKVPTKYIATIKRSFIKSGHKIHVLILPSGERYKNLNLLLKIINFAIKNKYERNDSFCALGGGVVSDLVGFAASIYYRGINFLCIPTTLLGMVDAAIGGKTAINIKEGKNLLGSFYQPKIVLIDPSCLKTLPKRELLTGLGEIIKYTLLEKTAKKPYHKPGFFNYLKRNYKNILSLKTNVLEEIIYHSSLIKAKIVSTDEKESNIRTILNLGHTFAHGIEQAYEYKKYTHGEAVSIGIHLATQLALKHNYLKSKDAKEIKSLLEKYNLPTTLSDKKKIDKIIKSMLLDKKVKSGNLRFIIPYKNIGSVKIQNNFSNKEIRSLLLDNISQ